MLRLNFVSVASDALKIMVDSTPGTAVAGMAFNTTCAVSKAVEGLINSPTVIWTFSNGTAVSNENGVSISTYTTNTDAISTLVFDPLKTSHGHRYVCKGALSSPALNLPLNSSTKLDLWIQSKHSFLCSYS